MGDQIGEEMQVEYRKDIRNQYLVINSEMTEKELNDYRVNMMIENRIPRFAACRAEYLNGKELLYYDITGRISIRDYLNEHKADESFFTGLFSGIADVIENMQEYLLDTDGLLLDPEYMFADREGKNISFIYYPFRNGSFSENCRSLSEKLLGSIKQDDICAVKAGYGFYKECMAGRITSVYLRDMAARRPDAAQKRPDEKHNAMPEKEVHEDYSFLFPQKEDPDAESRRSGFFNKIFKVKEKGKKYRASEKVTEKEKTGAEKMKFKNEISDCRSNEGRMETVFLNSDRQKEKIKAWLLPENDFHSNGIMLSEEKYVVGKKVAGADIALESKAVSRVHAKLIWQDGFYCIVDLSSKNGTRVNGVRLECGEKISLNDGDRIVFADMGCVYKQLPV